MQFLTYFRFIIIQTFIKKKTIEFKTEKFNRTILILSNKLIIMRNSDSLILLKLSFQKGQVIKKVLEKNRLTI